MTNPPNVTGPANPIDPGRSSEPIKPGSAKFRDYMKVKESDEKQKKKKKRPEETEEEKKASLQALPSLPEEKVAPIHKKSAKHAKAQKAKEQKARSEEEVAPPAPPPPQEEIAPLLPEPEEKPLEKPALQEKAKTAQPVPPKHAPIQPPAATPLGLSFLTPTSELPPAYTLLPAPILALFEQMVSRIVVMQSRGDTETTIHLSTPEFLSTPFADARIIIREYSSAPLAYNIELIGNPEATALFQQNLPSLQAAFQDKRYRFRVNRLEASHAKSAVRKVERKGDVE